MYTTTAPTSGPVLSFVLNVMSGFYGPGAEAVDDGRAEGSFRNWTLADKGLFMHRMVETLKHAYGRRANLGDPAFLRDDIVFRQVIQKLHFIYF